MTTKCPTCSRPLDGDTITGRLLALLAESERPLPSGEIARQLGVQKTTIYQTTHRLADRGSIRRAVVGGYNGWVLTPQVPAVPQPEVDLPPEVRSAVAASEAVLDFLAHTPSIGQETLAMMCRGDLDLEMYEEAVIAPLVHQGLIRVEEGVVYRG